MALRVRACAHRSNTTPIPHKQNAIPRRNYSNRLNRGDIIALKGKREATLGDVVHSKNRPNLVVSSDVVNKEFNKVILTLLSTAPARLPFEITLPADSETGLSKPSKVMANQVFTISLPETDILKMGFAYQYMPSVNKALKICFHNTNLSTEERKHQTIARGDLVEIDVGDTSYEGIVVSNDLGNLHSKIARIAHSTKFKSSSLTKNLEIIVQVDDAKNARQLHVECHTINTFAQSVISKKGGIREQDMIRITKMLYAAIGIDT